MDLTESIAPKSDQLDAIELVSGPRIFTIEKVSTHNAEQPFNFHLAGFPRVWRPGKSMRRIIVAAWGSNADEYTGQRLTLYCDSTIQFGNDTVGGTRISHMSGIDKPLKVPLLVKRGKSALFTVQPLAVEAPAPTDESGRDWITELDKTDGNLDAIASLGVAARAAHAAPEVMAAITSEYARAKNGDVTK